MEHKYLDVDFYILGEPSQQEASVRTDVTGIELIQEIVAEFELDEAESYVLLKEDGEPLDPMKTLATQDVLAGDVLLFERFSLQSRRSIGRDAHQAASLLDRRRSHSYPIEWTPALIGRSDEDQHHMAHLAVDLEALLGRSVSRKHAQITREGVTYYIEGLSSYNRCYLNDRELQVGVRYPIQNGDQFRPKKGNAVVLEFVLT